MRRTTRTSIAAAIGCLLAGGASAQSASEGEEPLPPPPERGEPVIIRPIQAPAVRPVQPGEPTPREALPALGGQDIATHPGRLLRDGAFLAQQRGVPLETPTGEWVVAFQNPGLPPMVLLPSRQFERLVRSLEGREGRVAVRVSGQVGAFRGRNYLLPTLLAVEPLEPATDDRAPEEGADRASEPPAEDARDLARGALEDQRVEALVRELESASREADGADRPLVGGDADPEDDPRAAGAAGHPTLEDGQVLIRRPGRLVRLRGGRWGLAFDQGPRGGPVPPLVMLPNATLERLEGLARAVGGEPRVLVSGRVHLFEGRGHLLAQSFVREPPDQLRPMQ